MQHADALGNARDRRFSNAKIPPMETTPVLFPTLLGTSEAAAALGVHRATISRHVKAGDLSPAGTLAGGRHVFTIEEVERFKARRTRKPYTRRVAA